MSIWWDKPFGEPARYHLRWEAVKKSIDRTADAIRTFPVSITSVDLQDIAGRSNSVLAIRWLSAARGNILPIPIP